MPSNSTLILDETDHPDDSTVETVTGEKYKGDGYYSRSDGIHTVQYNVAGFVGTIDIQATLAVTPTADDWFTVTLAQHVSANDSTDNANGSFIYNFTGNYVWVRAYINNWTTGTVNSILLNH